MINDIVDLQRYPLDRPESEVVQTLVRKCRRALDDKGLFNLDGFLLPTAVEQAITNAAEQLRNHAFRHEREHNIYFLAEIAGLDSDHPALKRFKTVNHTVCSDQIRDNVLIELYEWPHFAAFLARVMRIPRLYPMDDEISRLNILAYSHGEALNWHFDRSEFTTTLLLQCADAGGEFQYRSGLRSDIDPNYEGIGEFLSGDQQDAVIQPLQAGSLNVFRGKNTLHRVTPVIGDRQRIIAVFSYYENPGVEFSSEEKLGFYGRTRVM